MLDLEQLDAFVTFAEHLSFTHAARARHLSQPALFGQIKKLSAELGVELYQKRGRELELTADGERVLAFGREIRAKISGFLGESETTTLAAGAGAYLYLLGPAIREFLAKKHGPLRLLTRDRERTFHAVSTGEAQLGVAPADALPPGLHAEPLAEIGQSLALPKSHALAKRDTIRLRDLRDQELIVPAIGQPHRTLLARALSNAEVEWSVAVEANGWELMLGFVALGIAPAVVNSFCVPPPNVVLRPIPELGTLRYLLISRTAQLEGPGAALAELLKAHANDWKNNRRPENLRR